MKRNKFNLSYTRLASMDMGVLYPIGIMEVLPGDSIQHATSALVRASPLIAPVMHPVHVNIHHFYVPNRIVWDGWEDFITGGPDGMDLQTVPWINIPASQTRGLADYFGLPSSDAPGIPLERINALPYRAYSMIWNEYYRDQDLQSPRDFSTGSGLDSTTSQSLVRVNWEKDYFTTSRPWEQKGPAVTVPLQGTFSVTPDAYGAPTFTGGGFTNHTLKSFQGEGNAIWDSAQNATNTSSMHWEDPHLDVLQNGQAGITVNQLREALAIQRYEEARARYGSRYTEYLRYLGIRSSDARLQRPEFLGGGRNTIQFSEVLQTVEAIDGPLGQLGGHGIAGVRSNRYRRFFEEHGMILSLMFIRPKTIYMQGARRMWLKRIKEDFWQRELEHIGQQPVLKGEIYYDKDTANETFGYQDRYDEYRRNESNVAGDFKTTLDFWHLARKFESAPALNATFARCQPSDRIFAVTTENTIWCQIKHSIQARRIIAREGTSSIR